MKRLMVPWLAVLMVTGGCETGRQPAFVEPWDTLPRLESIALDYARAHHVDFDFSNTHPETGTKEITDVAYLYYYHTKDQPYYRFKIERDGQVLEAGLMIPAAISRKPNPVVAAKPPVESATNAVAGTNAPAQAAPAAPPPPAQGAVQATVASQPATVTPAAAQTAPGANGSETPKRPAHPAMAPERQFAEFNCAISIPSDYEPTNSLPTPPKSLVMSANFVNVLAGSGFFINVSLAPHAEIDDIGVSNLEQAVVKEWKDLGIESELVSGRIITVAGVKAYERVGWMTIGKKRLSSLAYLMCADGKAYVVQAVCKGDISERPEMRATLDTFRFLKPPAPEASAASDLGSSLRSRLAGFRITRRLGIVIGAVVVGIAVVGVLLSRLGRRGPP